MIKARVSFHRKTKVFVTHMHGDHVLGLPGLLQTMSLLGKTNELEIYGPKGIKAFVDAINQTVSYTLTFPLKVLEKEPGVVCDEKEYTVTAIQSIHLNPSLIYALTEKPRPGIFHPEKTKELRIPEGPLWSKLQSGSSVKLPDGRIVEPEMVLGASRHGRKIVYTGDTGPSENLVRLPSSCTLCAYGHQPVDPRRKQCPRAILI